MKLVQLGLRLNLIQTYDQCQEAFRLLDIEFEARVSEKYRPGFEAKLMKDYIAWLEEGKPTNDSRQEKYQKMKASMEEIKDYYRSARQAVKKIITPLKAAR